MFSQGLTEGASPTVPLATGGRGDKVPFVPDDSCGDDIFEGANEDLRSPQLPHLTQDSFTCERAPTEMPVILAETDELLLSLTPQYGGKIWSLYDKVNKQDMFFDNPAHQPANIGALKAWASGGAEWNWSPGITGHSAFTEMPVWTAIIPTEKGDMIRVWEFDRYNGTIWQVDILLYQGALWVHPKIRNPTSVDLRGYWWTCVANHVTPGSRIVTPATHVAETTIGVARNSAWPRFATSLRNSSFSGYQGQWGTDNSYLGNIIFGDFFVRIPEPLQPYIAHVDEQGYTIYHGHPLNGTKFFTWGQTGPGRFMQDWLSGNTPQNSTHRRSAEERSRAAAARPGDYAELQVGPAPTQMQTFAFPAKSTKEWTEVFKGAPLDSQALHQDDYSRPLATVESWLRSSQGLPASNVSTMDDFFKAHSDDAVLPGNILSRGTPWGALHALLLGQPGLGPGTLFQMNDTHSESLRTLTGGNGGAADSQAKGLPLEARPWLELLTQGTFSAQSLGRLPVSYMVSPLWVAKLKASAASKGATWLHNFHLAVAAMEAGVVDAPRKLLQQVLTDRSAGAGHALAARGLALLSADDDSAYAWFLEAWALAGNVSDSDPSKARLLKDLAKEVCSFLLNRQRLSQLASFLHLLPKPLQGTDIVMASRVVVAVQAQAYQEAITLLESSCFSTYARDRSLLMQLWSDAQAGILQQQLGRPPTPVEAHHLRLAKPIPRNIGCAYISTYCLNYW